MVIIVTYGAGTNSTALLIECFNRGIKIDLIIFSDTGAERPHTYQYVKTFSKWLVDNGMPEIVTVRKGGNGETLEEECLRMKCLPPIAYGFKTCSHKYKIQPVDKYLNNWQPSKDVWKKDEKATKFIGFDADESHRIKDFTDDKYEVRYPLVEWDMGRDDCIKTIQDAGLCLPGKSACFFCPNSKQSEIKQLQHVYPDLAKRCIEMEANAMESLTQIKGLGRNFSWTDLMNNPDMFEDDFDFTPEMTCGCYDG